MELTEEQLKEARRKFARAGWDALKEKHGIEKMREWGKKGGRPRKKEGVCPIAKEKKIRGGIL